MKQNKIYNRKIQNKKLKNYKKDNKIYKKCLNNQNKIIMIYKYILMIFINKNLDNKII